LSRLATKHGVAYTTIARIAKSETLPKSRLLIALLDEYPAACAEATHRAHVERGEDQTCRP